MAAPAPSDFLRISDLPPPSALPAELRGRPLFTKVTLAPAPTSTSEQQQNQSSTSHGQQRAEPKPRAAKGADFNYGKALQAALSGAGSSVTSRGDGKLEGGRDFAISDAPGGRAKVVHLTPDALAPERAEATLQELDRLQQAAGARSRVAGTSQAPASQPQPRSSQHERAAALAAAAGLLYDITDDEPASATPAAAPIAAPPAAAAPAGAAPQAGAPSVPQHEVAQRGGELEVSVLLPGVGGPGEVDVLLCPDSLRVVVPGRYLLELCLPCVVLEDTSRAKWSKAKQRLTLTLSRAAA